MKQPTYPEGWDAERVLAYGLWQFTHRSARALYERKDFLDERFILPDRCLVDVQIWNRVKILEADRSPGSEFHDLKARSTVSGFIRDEHHAEIGPLLR